MSSAFLESIGLGFIDIGYVLIGMTAAILILLILLIVQISKTNKIKKRFEKFMTGKDAKSLEKEIAELFIRKLFHNMEYTYQKCGIVKYDAFQQMGGKLSFSLALLNERNDGFILNSVHSSDGCYSYTKEIIGGECKISLGEEEESALKLAMGEEV